MQTPDTNRLMISVEKQGPTHIQKASFPLRYGRYSEIRTPDHEFIFSLNGEIKFIRGLHAGWPHPAEQLKRTDGNDWVYYTVGDKSGENGIISWLGEYYLPCLPYPSNPIWAIDYYANPAVMNAFAAWSQLFANLCGAGNERLHPKARAVVNRIIEHHDGVLHEKAKRLNEIIGERVSVLPPDARHVDYEVVPLVIAEGCLYHCKFCCVQSTRTFRPRDRNAILDQIQQLKDFYGRNLENYNGLFLGNHDALAAGEELICGAAAEALGAFGFGGPERTPPRLFMFGSIHSLLKATRGFFEKLNALPFHACINVGLESVDPATLAHIGKPVDPADVYKAFQKMLEVNAAYPNVEITGNFVIGNGLPAAHDETLKQLLQSAPSSPKGKGAVYLSPLKDSPKKRELLPLVQDIKAHSRLPVYIYLIQRL